jgi:hypothetical protein
VEYDKTGSPGSTQTIRQVITAKGNAKAGLKQTWKVTVTSQGDSSRVDTVATHATVT